MKAAQYMNSLTAANRKKSSASTKPTCITEEGTLYRICNTIIEKKDDFIATKDSHDQGDHDTRKAKAVHWESMTKHYHQEKPSLNKLSPAGSNALIGHSIPSNVCTDCDVLKPDEFQACVDYILAHYREARNNQTKSGNHRPFDSYVGGKKWLLYFHSVLEELGDRNVKSCAYPTLSEDITRTSDSAHIPLNRSNRRSLSASPRSMSGSSVGGMSTSIRNQKQSAIEATEAAATSIQNKNLELQYTDGFDRMMKLKNIYNKVDMKYRGLKKKRKMHFGEELREINTKLKSMKKERREYELEIERIKKAIEYESPDVSDVSDDTDSDIDAGGTSKASDGKKGDGKDSGKKGDESDNNLEEFEDANCV